MNQLNLMQYGYAATEPLPEGLLPARVTAVHRERYEIITDDGFVYGKLKTGVYYNGESETFPTVGDFVWFSPVRNGDAQIVKTLPRKSLFTRRDPNPFAGDQVVAANMDYVFIMTSLNQDFNVNRVERYLTLARQSGAQPVVILTKADLCEDAEAQAERIRAVAENAEVIPISTADGTGLERLNAYLLPGKTVVFLGMSGVGKSSLINHLLGKEAMEVSGIREDDARGRHTTTHRQLFMLPSGAMVIDTPGMRSLGLWSAKEGVSETFADIEALVENCRFSDCKHQNEPGCAVQKAIKNGELTAARWENYQKLSREALFDKDKSAYMKSKQARFKEIAVGKHKKK